MFTRRTMVKSALALTAGFPGRRSQWLGYDRHDFEHEGRAAVVVSPRRAAPRRPWLWWAEFFGAFTTLDRALLDRGWHLAFVNCRDTFGNDETMRCWETFHGWLTGTHGLAPRPVLVGVSRGGVYAYRWAARHPDKTGLIYGDAPVCDVKSWPGGRGKGRGSPKDWRLFQRVYGLDEAGALAWRGNPSDVLAPLARARIPILHVVGDADDVVPLAENTAVLAARYRALGGRIEVIEKKGVGHHPHGPQDVQPVVDFILAHARA
jgi:pimeloyl-ACP methyl ester carboxylesterase